MGSFTNFILEKLRKLYKQELAIAKQHHNFENENEEFEALALFDLDKKVGDAVSAYLDTINGHENIEAMAGVYAYLEGLQLGILSHIESLDEKAVDFVEQFTENWIKKIKESRDE